MQKDYLEWLDWKPGILRAIFELGSSGEIILENMKASGREEIISEISEYLIGMNIFEYDPEKKLQLSQFGRDLYNKLLEINYLFTQYVEIPPEDSD
ncbi:MAG TPA: hypothetical protein VKU79_01580 [Thermoplasmataceae archaeon]|nr:hypothetical protein [Thermoplasmatales archaeon AK]HLH85539.1 hypothetical protein [Thermoplasmataceae archaeon]